MSKKNKLMFWGGEYQEPLALPPARVRQGGLLTPLSLAGQLQKPAALLNLKRSGRATQLTTAGENATADKDPTAFPVLEFRVKQDVRYIFHRFYPILLPSILMFINGMYW